MSTCFAGRTQAALSTAPAKIRISEFASTKRAARAAATPSKAGVDDAAAVGDAAR